MIAVDDALMGITHVIRAEEHLTNTLRQCLILEALKYPQVRPSVRPCFTHTHIRNTHIHTCTEVLTHTLSLNTRTHTLH